jgi:hypothetical protein
MRFFLLVYQYCADEVAELTDTSNHISCLFVNFIISS